MVLTLKFHVCQRHANKDFTGSYTLNLEIVTLSFSRSVIIIHHLFATATFFDREKCPGQTFLSPYGYSPKEKNKQTILAEYAVTWLANSPPQ